MEKKPTVYLSNYLEILAEKLKKNLFSSSTPFAKRYLVVPSPRMKEWLSENFAKDPSLQISMGVKFLYFEEALTTLASCFFLPSCKPRIKDLELLLSLAQESGKNFSYCKNLALLFKRYGIYSRGKLENLSAQADYYQKIFSSYSTDYEYFKNLTGQEVLQKQADFSLHFFGFHHISPLHAEFLLKLPNLSFYTLSPCQEFWSDFLTDKEIKHFFHNKRLNPELRLEWENYLEDRHPLLANWGKVGRKWAQFIEEADLLTEENYILPKTTSLLGRVQSSLLQLQQEKISCLSEEEDSLQVHLFTSRHREIQGLFHQLAFLLQEKRYLPSDITIFAPDISLYTPYIETYFGKEIPYRIISNDSAPSDSAEAFRLLTNLEKKRWNPESVMELIFHPLFLHRLKSEERELFKKWIESERIHFGFDLAHANVLLKKNHCQNFINDESRTWKAAFERLFLAYAKNSSFPPQASFAPEIIQSDLFATVAHLLHSLKEDLAIFYDETQLSLEDWVDYLQSLLEAYFIPLESREKLEEFKYQSGKFQKSLFSFSTLLPFFEEHLYKSNPTLSRTDYNQITFATLLSGRVTPSKIIVLLGMNQEEFPRKESFAPLDQLQMQKEKDYYPLTSETDRYLFLEALLMAREHFLISYLGKSLADQSPLLPSSVVSELLFYLPPEVVQKIVVIHPHFSFDPLYFDKQEPLLKNYSQSDFHTCKLIFEPKKTSYFIPEFYHPHSINCTATLPEGKHLIDITDFRKLLRYPLKFFLEKNLSLGIKNTTNVEEFSLSGLDRYHFRHLAFQNPVDEVVGHFETAGRLPAGSFKEVALLRLKKEAKERKKNLLGLGIKVDELHEQTIVHNFIYDEKTEILLIGKIPMVTSHGLLCLDKCQLSSGIRTWSDFLLLNLLSPTPQLLLFDQEGITKNPFFTDAKAHVKKLIHYYFLASKIPIPLLPEWVEPILAKNIEKLEQKILTTQEGLWDESLHFAFRNHPPVAQQLVEDWGSLAQSLFQEMKDGWF